MTKFRTRHVVLVLSAAALAAGCGSSTKSKTSAKAPATPSTPSTTATTALPSSLKTQFLAAVQPFVGAAKQLQANPQAAKDPATFTHLAITLKQSASNVSKISVPPSAQGKVKQFVALLDQEAATADQLAADLKIHNQSAFQSDLQKFRQIGSQISSL